MNAKAGKPTGVVKDRERPGRGCQCCSHLRGVDRKQRERRTARRVAKQKGWA